MSTIDILFWLLVVLLGGIVWGIEAGLGQRYRTMIMSSTAATMLTMGYLMFWVEDITRMQPLPKHKYERKSGDGGDRGEVDFGQGGGGKRGGGGGTKGGGGGGGGGGSSGSGSSAKDDPNAKPGDGTEEGRTDDENAEAVYYTREPFKDCPVCPSIVIVPAGVAQVGSAPDERGRTAEEQPAATTPMPKAFAIGRLEILRGEYAAFATETGHNSTAVCDVGRRRGRFSWRGPGFEQDERHPVTCLNWTDVNLYLNWLRGKTGRVYRLPTEAEWEHSARAGTTTPQWNGPTLNRSLANIGRSRDGTIVGGMLGANPWGLSDHMGNVWEMTSQCVAEDNRIVDPRPEQPDCRRVLKGGAWSSPPTAARHASRRFISAGYTANDIGFRVMREVDDRDAEKILTREQRIALEKAEKDVAEQKAREEAEAEEKRRKAREAAEAEDAAERAKAERERLAKGSKK